MATILPEGETAGTMVFTCCLLCMLSPSEHPRGKDSEMVFITCGQVDFVCWVVPVALGYMWGPSVSCAGGRGEGREIVQWYS